MIIVVLIIGDVMAECKKIYSKHRKVCLGGMRDQIILYDRAITAPASGSVDFTETFSNATTVWAMLETISGKEIFDGTNLVGVATHKFYIRYISDVTAQTWIKFKSQYFDIIDTQNLEERDEFLLLRCSIRGDSTKEVNFSR